MRYKLRLKILILATSTPVVLGLSGIWFVDRGVQQNVRSTTEENLRRAALVCENNLSKRSRTLQISAQAIAEDPRFLSALTLPVSRSDPRYRETVRGAAREINKITETDLLEVFDPKGQLIAAVGSRSTTAKSRRRLLDQMHDGRAATGFVEAEQGGVCQAAVHPVAVPGRTIGTLLLGELIDKELGNQIKAQTRCEISFLTAGKLLVTTLPSTSDQTVLIEALESQSSSSAAVSSNTISEMKSPTETYLTLARAIPGEGKGAPIFVVQRSFDEETAFLSGIHDALTKLGAVIVLAAIVLGVIVARMITGPILQLVRGAEQMERGNYEYPITVGTNDEIGYLAERFRDLRDHERAYVSSLEEAARLKSDFLNVASHELRTPTSIIKAYGELLSSDRLGPTNGEQKKALGVIDQQLEGIERIVEDAAWLSQVQGERPTLDLEEHPVQDLINVAVESATADAAGRKHQLMFDVDPEVGQARVDGPRLKQAIANLVRNAIRFTPDRGHISVRAHRDDGELVIEVQDSGIGIAEDKKQHLFNRSFMFRNSLEHHSSRTLEFNSAGLGLGLPLARGIVEAHGGTIQVTSDVGRGSTFTIRLPMNHSAVTLAAA